MSLSRYAKMYVAAVGALTTWAATYFPENADFQKVLGLLGVLGTVALVYGVPNTPPKGEEADPEMSEQG